jgi:hypothetical protein
MSDKPALPFAADDSTGTFAGPVPSPQAAAPAPVIAPPQSEVHAKMAKMRDAVGRRPPPKPTAGRTANRYKTAPPAPAQAGVGSTEATQKGAEPARYEAEGSITRMSLEERQVTSFDLPRHRMKPGWDYKWEPLSVMGQRVDRAVIRDAYKAGWRPERAADWPELMVGAFEKFGADDTVEEGGQMLMGRPIHLSQEAQLETYNKARMQERDRMQSAATGQAMGGHEGLANVRGIEVRNPSLSVELSSGSGPRGG